jgi:hypothetical protein
VSRGIGKTQHAILDLLAGQHDWPALPVMEVARRLDRSDRQIRCAVRALEARGLVDVGKDSDWHGEGEYGLLAWRDGEQVRIGMPCVALWVSLPGTGQQWAEDTRRTLAEDTEWQTLVDGAGRLFGGVKTTTPPTPV